MPQKNHNIILVRSEKEEELRAELAGRDDPEGRRLTRFLNMPDLSRKEGSPLAELVRRMLNIERFADFDIVQAPEIERADRSFDLFNFPEDHPARSRSDTYYVNDDYILRPHTTTMWYYHVNDPEVKKRMGKKEPVGALSYGKVYRRDEIDRNHMNVFHQVDGWYLTPKEEKVITVDDLKDVLVEIAHALFGEDVKYRFNKDRFPYTDPSIEMEIEVRGDWVEILGCGLVRPVVLENFGVDADVYNGWAFGFGLERLAIISMELPDIRLLWSDDPRVTSQLTLGNTYEEVSPYPPITRDISFVVDSDFEPNDYFDLIRDIGGDLVEEAMLLDKYEDEEKFGEGKTSYTYRIIYRSHERTLESDEVDPLQDKLYEETAKQFNAELR